MRPLKALAKSSVNVPALKSLHINTYNKQISIVLNCKTADSDQTFGSSF